MLPTLSPPLVLILQVILLHPPTYATPSPELHLCNRIETYMDNVEVLVEEPVKMKRYQWCVGVPPRCTTFTTELKNRTKIEAVEKNRTVTECCTGFVEINSECVRECPPNQPCPNMKCQDTKHCFCLAGYTGLYCNTTCPVGRWGSNCTSKCQCGDVNGNKCHHLTGKCILLTPVTVPTTLTMPTLPTVLTTLMPPATIPTVTSTTQQLTTSTLATPSTTTATTTQSTTTTTTQRPTTSTTTTTTPKPTTPTTTVVTTTPTPPPTTTMQLPNLIPSSMKPLNPLGPGIFTNLDTSLFETGGFLTTKPPVDTTKQGGDPFTNLDSVNAFDHYSTKMNMHPTTPFNGGNEFLEKGISGLPGVPALPTVKAEEDWPYTIPKLTTIKPNLNPEDVMSKVVNQLENVPTPFIPLETTRKPIIDDDLIIRKIAPIAEAVPKSLPGFGQSSGSRLNIMTTQNSILDVGIMNNNNGINMDTIPKIPNTIPQTFSDIPLSFPVGTTTPRPLIDGIIEHISPTTAKPSAIDMINKGFIPNIIPSSIIPSAQPTLPTIPSEVPLIPTQAGSRTRVIDKLNIISSELDKGFKSVVSSVINKYNNSSNPPTTTPKSFYGVVNTVVNTINKTNHQSGIDGLINQMKPNTNTMKIPDTSLPTLPAAIPTFPAVNADFSVPDLIPSTEVSPFVTPSKHNSIDSILSAVSTNNPSFSVPSLPPNFFQPVLPAMTTARPSIPNIPIPNITQTLNDIHSIQHSLPDTTVSTLVNLGRDVVSNINALGAGVNTNFMNPSTGSHGHPVDPVPTMVSMNPVSNHNFIPELTHTTGQSLSHVPPTSGSSHNVNIPSIPTNLNLNVTLNEDLHHNIISPAVPTLSNHHSTVQPRETFPHFLTNNLNFLTTPNLPTYKPQSQTNSDFSHKLNVSSVPTHGVPELHSYQPPSIQSSTIAPLVNSLHNVASHLPTIPDVTLNIPPLTHPSLPPILSSQPPTLLTIKPHPATDFKSQLPTFQEAPIINDDFHSLSPPVSVPPQNAVTPQSKTITLQTASPKPVNPDLDKAIGIFENSLNDLMKEMEGIGLKKASDISKNSKSMPSRRTFGQKVDLPKDKFDQALDGGLNQLRHDVVNLQLVSQNDEPSRDRISGIQNDGPKQDVDNIKPEPQHGEGPQNNETKTSDKQLKFDAKTNFFDWDVRVVLPKKSGSVEPEEGQEDTNYEDSLVDSGPRLDVASLRLGSPNSVFSQVAAISEEDNEFKRDQNYHPTSVGLNLIYIPDDTANQQQADSTTRSSQFYKSVPVTVSSIVLILCLVLTGLCYVLHRRRRRNDSAVVDETLRREERLEENTRETGSLERRTQLQESFCRFVNPHSIQMLTELKESQYQSPPTPQPIYEEIQW